MAGEISHCTRSAKGDTSSRMSCGSSASRIYTNANYPDARANRSRLQVSRASPRAWRVNKEACLTRWRPVRRHPICGSPEAVATRSTRLPTTSVRMRRVLTTAGSASAISAPTVIPMAAAIFWRCMARRCTVNRSSRTNRDDISTVKTTYRLPRLAPLLLLMQTAWPTGDATLPTLLAQFLPNGFYAHWELAGCTTREGTAHRQHGRLPGSGAERRFVSRWPSTQRGESRVLSQSSIIGQNPKIGCQECNDLQTPKLLKKQLCNRTSGTAHLSADEGMLVRSMDRTAAEEGELRGEKLFSDHT
jgi:hypothetical protein